MGRQTGVYHVHIEMLCACARQPNRIEYDLIEIETEIETENLKIRWKKKHNRKNTISINIRLKNSWNQLNMIY